MTDLDRSRLELRVDPIERRPETHVSLAWVAVTVFVILAVLAYATSRAAQEEAGGTSLSHPGLLGTPHGDRETGGGQTLRLQGDASRIGLEGTDKAGPGPRPPRSQVRSGDDERLGLTRPIDPSREVPAVIAGVTVGVPLSLSGWATWFDATPGTAAAGPDLRAWLGDWRGQTVKVCHRGCVLVVLTQVCACGDRSGIPTLVDLDRQSFAVLGDPSAGVISVTVSRAGAIALPATDVALHVEHIARDFAALLLLAIVFSFAFGVAFRATGRALKKGRPRA